MRERHRAEWLRRLVRRKPKYATGGLVSGPKPGDAPLVSIGQGGCAWPRVTSAEALREYEEPYRRRYEAAMPSAAEIEEFSRRIREAMGAHLEDEL